MRLGNYSPGSRHRADLVCPDEQRVFLETAEPVRSEVYARLLVQNGPGETFADGRGHLETVTRESYGVAVPGTPVGSSSHHQSGASGVCWGYVSSSVLAS